MIPQDVLEINPPTQQLNNSESKAKVGNMWDWFWDKQQQQQQQHQQQQQQQK